MGRSHKALKKVQGTVCSNCKQPVLAHQVCKNCGYYKGKQVVRTKEDVMTKRETKRKTREDKMKAKK